MVRRVLGALDRFPDDRETAPMEQCCRFPSIRLFAEIRSRWSADFVAPRLAQGRDDAASRPGEYGCFALTSIIVTQHYAQVFFHCEGRALVWPVIIAFSRENGTTVEKLTKACPLVRSSLFLKMTRSKSSPFHSKLSRGFSMKVFAPLDRHRCRSRNFHISSYPSTATLRVSPGTRRQVSNDRNNGMPSDPSRNPRAPVSAGRRRSINAGSDVIKFHVAR